MGSGAGVGFSCDTEVCQLVEWPSDACLQCNIQELSVLQGGNKVKTINKACMCSIHCGDCPLPPLKGVERDNILLKSNLDIAVAVWSHVGASRFNDPFQISSEAPPFEPWMVSCKKGYVCIQAFSLSHLLHWTTSLPTCNECLKAVLCQKNDGGLDEGKKGFWHSLKAVIFTNCGVSYDLFTVLLTMGPLS